jgi:hypothetical protein
MLLGGNANRCSRRDRRPTGGNGFLLQAYADANAFLGTITFAMAMPMRSPPGRCHHRQPLNSSGTLNSLG